MESYYEVNVTRGGKHLFATAPRSGRLMLEQAVALFTTIAEAFPDCEVRLTRWQGHGRDVAVMPAGHAR